MNPEFWAGRRVLLTGHTGFKGAWLALWLARLGARVHGLALPPETQPNLFAEALGPTDIESHIADLRDPAAVARVVEAAAPEVVLHLAAQPLVRRSHAEPVETFATNVMGTAHLLQALRPLTGLRAVVIVTSDKAYLNREWVWPYREEEALGGKDPYSASKACTEILAGAWRQSFFGGGVVATARAGNVIGGGDWAADRLLPDLVRAIRAGRPLELRNPDATRPWQHVLEPLAGYLMLAERLAAGGCAEAWNFGPEEAEALPVSAVAAEAAAAWGGGVKIRLAAERGPAEAMQLRVDSSKARARLGWRPRLPTAEAIAWTMRWYARHAAGEPARALALEQIDAYAEKARA
ncbi:CDP-glucose 4,6-dehydratase [Belnapia mucosa]|uniref:CDP-glucose 4,6-dehydratase n=1 Tax=Belnapia mucosa TaxID=2804532 RepID=UPI002E2A5384|nr:CDP-glucose 4,6-dehydratase [Belnapia mucosa]